METTLPTTASFVQPEKIPNGCEFKGWIVISEQGTIASQEVVKREHERLGQDLPDMLFPQACLSFHHLPSDSVFKFCGLEALETRLKTGEIENVKVAGSTAWSTSREALGVKKLEKEHDWTFTLDYTGSATRKGVSLPAETTNEKIDWERLKKPDPILHFGECILFEDELSDNGLVQLSCRVRVMPSLVFALVRFWLRVDGVIFRVRDIRFYHEFGKDYVLREIRHCEAKVEEMRKFVPPDAEELVWFAEMKNVAPLVPCVMERTEKIQFQ